ncbi:MAG: hypothetical protein LBV19_02960 [Streptococcaceae bacterium]|jgi:hypothetical protein|nr:hypothetical protein [Streptococcaceae bacterium]
MKIIIKLLTFCLVSITGLVSAGTMAFASADSNVKISETSESSSSSSPSQQFDSTIRVGETYQANTQLGTDLVYESVTFIFDGVSTTSKSGKFVTNKPGILTVQYNYHYKSSSHIDTALGNLIIQILPENAGKTSALFRLYNPNSGEHFYTNSSIERDSLAKSGWKNEGIAEQAPVIDKSVPVYRVYNPNSGLHHFTIGLYEKNQLVSLGWRDEGIGWYSNSDPENGVSLYRVYNPNSGQHLYTTGSAERDQLASLGWRDEGIAWYGLK